MKHVVVSLVLASAALLPALARADDTAPRRPTEIVVHMTGARATLHGATPQGGSIDCEAPCDRALPADGEYWVGATRFTLDRDQRHVTLDVNASKSGARVGGIALLLLGSIATLTGATIFGFDDGHAARDRPLLIQAVQRPSASYAAYLNVSASVG